MTGYVTSVKALISYGSSSPTRSTKTFVMICRSPYEAGKPLKVTSAKAFIAMGSNAPVRSTYTMVLRVVSTHRHILPIFEDPEPADLPYSAELTQITDLIVEINPYRPDVPREYIDALPEHGTVFYDYQRQVQETLRHQHNLIQVGDTTYHWFVLTKVTEDRKWTLGSHGRFYHETWGLIEGRYVQFDKMIDDDWLGAPVGRLKTAETTEWVVTNDILKSDPDWVMGFIASFQHINDRDYGWIITSGVNLYSIRMEQSEIPARDEPLVWSSTTRAKAGIAGKSFGRVVVPGPTANIPPGGAWIEVEGYTDNYYIDLLTGSLAGTLDQFTQVLNDHERRITELEESTVNSSIEALTQRVTILEQRVTNETSQRIAADNALHAEIDALPTFNDLTTLETSLISYVDSVAASLQIQITAAQDRADQAYELAASIDVAAATSIINIHTEQISELYENMALAEKIYMPVVNGDVPPVLMYNEEGSLIYAAVDVGH